jgi:molybdate transport system permease protein
MSFDGLELSAIRVSAQVMALATLMCIVVGTTLAWYIARSGRRVAALLSALALLPLVIPPSAVGYYLLYAFGRQSTFGNFLIDDVGLRLVFTWPGAAIAAGVVSLPLFVRTAQAGFEQIDPELLAVASTMASPFRAFVRVALPLAWPALVAATLIAAARSLGEFGATVIIAGNIPGETQTVPAAIYDAVQAGDRPRANALAFFSLVFGLVVLAGLSLVLQRQRYR